MYTYLLIISTFFYNTLFYVPTFINSLLRRISHNDYLCGSDMKKKSSEYIFSRVTW